MSITRKLAKLILTLLTLPLLVVVWLLKWFVTFLHCCSAWIFYLLGSVLLATAVLSFLMKQSQGIEALQMLIGGFGGRQCGGIFGTGSSNDSASMVHIRR
ncbi:MAG: hypothetical protein BHV91_04065 [Clostridiales bacterium 44_9]|nr:MAG: hypothetical protein BHV91_04065 [Clostridiales bacterium 44_9]